ncbi:hypothetical protein L1887_05131 [Cichorium endivia]|nr:hypothetical protein L1887_05131 [Cichorium endivia]
METYRRSSMTGGRCWWKTILILDDSASKLRQEVLTVFDDERSANSSNMKSIDGLEIRVFLQACWWGIMEAALHNNIAAYVETWLHYLKNFLKFKPAPRQVEPNTALGTPYYFFSEFVIQEYVNDECDEWQDIMVGGHKVACYKDPKAGETNRGNKDYKLA